MQYKGFLPHLPCEFSWLLHRISCLMLLNLNLKISIKINSKILNDLSYINEIKKKISNSFMIYSNINIVNLTIRSNTFNLGVL